VELTVLGGRGVNACSGYLLQSGDTSIWIDCGNGTFGHLQEHLEMEKLTAVVLTHGHPDHCVDIYGLHVMLRYGVDITGMPVYAPEGLEGYLLSLVHDFDDTFEWNPIGDGDCTKIGDIELRFSRTDHPPPTYAIEARADDRRMIYTADTGPGWTVGAFDAAADLVLSEATYMHDNRPAPIHLSAKQAGEAAREARAQRLAVERSRARGEGRRGSVRRGGGARGPTPHDRGVDGGRGHPPRRARARRAATDHLHERLHRVRGGFGARRVWAHARAVHGVGRGTDSPVVARPGPWLGDGRVLDASRVDVRTQRA